MGNTLITVKRFLSRETISTKIDKCNVVITTSKNIVPLLFRHVAIKLIDERHIYTYEYAENDQTILVAKD